MIPIDFNGLDTVVHGPVRLGVMTALHMEGSMSFTVLKKRLQVSDGSLGMHLQKLEEIGYIASTKAFVDHRPNTKYALTSRGRRAFAKYFKSMHQLLDAVEKNVP